MKKTFLILAVILLAACATRAKTGEEGRTYSVYEYPGKKEQGTLPAYRVKETPNGEVRVYEYGDPFEYKYRITPDGEVYKPGNPFEPVGNIKNGVPTHTERGRVMAILARCPMCREYQKTSNKFCKCGEDLDRAKKAKRVKYWIQYRFPDGKQKKECVGKSITEARAAHNARSTQKKENKLEDMLDIQAEANMTFEELSKWYLEHEEMRCKVKEIKTLRRKRDCFKNFNAVFGGLVVKQIDEKKLQAYQLNRLEAGISKRTVDYEMG